MANLVIDGSRQFTENIAKKSLRRCANDLAVLQLEQIAEAFRRGGQPSKKWAPLWADKFVGKVPEKAAGALINAQSAFFKVTSAKKPDAAKIARASERVQNANDKALFAMSYRRGGQPLRDAGPGGGILSASFFTKYNFVFDSEKSIVVVVASSAFYATWHQKGFKTKGPNFIPLTIKARREHQRGVNPKHEGLEYGVDYIMAWKGVNVPERPMIDYADPVNKKQIDDTIILNLKKG